jgi:hypothetical protein
MLLIGGGRQKLERRMAIFCRSPTEVFSQVDFVDNGLSTWRRFTAAKHILHGRPGVLGHRFQFTIILCLPFR